MANRIKDKTDMIFAWDTTFKVQIFNTYNQEVKNVGCYIN